MFSFSGRISRRGWWLGFLILAVVTVGGQYLIQPDVFDLEAELMPPPTLATNLFNLALMVPSMAITVKRLADRGWGRYVSLIVLIVFLPFAVGPFFGVLWDPASADTPIEVGAWWGLTAVAILLVIDNGFLRGTAGPNAFGPDPTIPDQTSG